MAWAEFDGKHLAFSDVQIEPVMRIATYERGRLRFWTDPFEMTVSGEFHVFTPSDSVQDVTLFAKYPLWQDEKYQKRMIGGVFEGSNDPDFRQKEVLFLIEKQPERLRTNGVFPFFDAFSVCPLYRTGKGTLQCGGNRVL